MNELKPVLKLKLDGTPYKRQPKKTNAITPEKTKLIEKLDKMDEINKSYAKTFTTDKIIVSFR